MKTAIRTNNKLGKQDLDTVDHRQEWMKDRLLMEAAGNGNRKSSRSGSWVSWAMKMFAWGLQATGTYQKGFQNARNIVLREQSLVIPGLPNSFNGFTILFLSDLHLDMMPGLERNIVELIGGREFDLKV